MNTLKLAALGIAIGVFASVADSQIISSLLFQTQPNDPAVFLGVAFLLVCVAVFAGYVPALRATRIHPAVALRCE
jgi:putative ABC transport system permease protein